MEAVVAGQAAGVERILRSHAKIEVEVKNVARLQSGPCAHEAARSRTREHTTVQSEPRIQDPVRGEIMQSDRQS